MKKFVGWLAAVLMIGLAGCGGGGSAEAPVACDVTGASVTADDSTVPGSTIYTFDSDGTISCTTAMSVQYLVVAGGGGTGGSNAAAATGGTDGLGGGGGGGGFFGSKAGGAGGRGVVIIRTGPLSPV
jgi:hypothetical protein